MQSGAIWIFASVFLWVACGNNPPDPISPAPAPPSGASAPSADARLANLLAELTFAVRKFGAEQRRVPASSNELVAAGYLKTVLQAPAGKKFVIATKELKVIVE